jgi:hypothetical protein
MQTNHIHKPTMPSSSNVLAQGTSSIMLNGYDSTPRVKNDITPVVQVKWKKLEIIKMAKNIIFLKN